MVTKTNLSSSVIDEIEHFKKNLQRLSINYDKVILFGSHAKGKSRKGSDIDLAVISPNFGKDKHSERMKLYEAIDKHSLTIEPHPYSQSDLLVKWDGLAREINTNGLEV